MLQLTETLHLICRGVSSSGNFCFFLVSRGADVFLSAAAPAPAFAAARAAAVAAALFLLLLLFLPLTAAAYLAPPATLLQKTRWTC